MTKLSKTVPRTAVSWMLSLMILTMTVPTPTTDAQLMSPFNLFCAGSARKTCLSGLGTVVHTGGGDNTTSSSLCQERCTLFPFLYMLFGGRTNKCGGCPAGSVSPYSVLLDLPFIPNEDKVIFQNAAKFYESAITADVSDYPGFLIPPWAIPPLGCFVSFFVSFALLVSCLSSLYCFRILIYALR
jgi:hypothetical protein